MLNKSPEILWNAVFNAFQGATMTLAMSLYQGQLEVTGLIKTFVCAYCAGVMLTLFLNAAGMGDRVAKALHCSKSPVLGYLVSGLVSGAIMGIFMNFFITFMVMGPVPAFPMAYLTTLPFAMLVSALASCCWVKAASLIVGAVYHK